MLYDTNAGDVRVNGKWYTPVEVEMATAVLEALAKVEVGNNILVRVLDHETRKGLTPFEAYFRRESLEETR
jgi:hypothetical protein